MSLPAAMDRTTAETLIDALGARSGVVAAVGAGGKKSTLYRLLAAHRALGTERILLTSTVQIAAPPKSLDVETVLVDDDGAKAAIAKTNIRTSGAWLIVGPSRKPGRFSGLERRLIPTLHAAGFGITLVKADGARMRMIKAPGDHEPALPDDTGTVLPVVSARVFGRPLDGRLVHRPERLADLLDVKPGTPLTPAHVARLLTSADGALRRTDSAEVVPVINMVDDDQNLHLARETAERALAATGRFQRVVLTSMASPSPLVDVIGA